MPPLSSYLDNPEPQGLSQEAGIEADLPPLMYADGRRFEGIPKVIKLSDPLQFVDENGVQLLIDTSLQPDYNPLDENIFMLVEPERKG